MFTAKRPRVVVSCKRKRRKLCIFLQFRFRGQRTKNVQNTKAHLRGGKPAFSAPKKGKKRMYARPQKLCKKKYSALWKKTHYVRHGNTKRHRQYRARWTWDMNKIASMGEKALITQLTVDGFLKDWTKFKCPHCSAGCVSPLQRRGGGSWAYRCRAAGCHKFILPHAKHPLFSTGWGDINSSRFAAR